MKFGIIISSLVFILIKTSLLQAQSLEKMQQKIESFLEINIDSAGKYSDILLREGYEELDKNKEHHALNYKAHIAYKKGQRMNALKLFLKSLEIREKHGKITEIANTLNWIGRIYHEQTDYNNAIDYYHQSLEKLKENPDSSYILSTLNNIAYLYLEIEDYEKMLFYNKQSLVISQAINAELEYANACNLKGIYFQNQQKLDSAEDYYKKSLVFYLNNNMDHKIAHQYNNLGIIYFFRGNYKKAYEHLINAKDIRKNLNDTATYAESLRNLGDYFLITENYDSSLYYYNKSLSLSLSIDSKKDSKEIYESLAEVYYEKGDYKKAYELHLNYTNLQKEVFSLEQSNKLIEIESKYKFKNQNEQFRLIAAHNKKLNDANLLLTEEKKISNIWTYILSVIILILCIACFMLYRKK